MNQFIRFSSYSPAADIVAAAICLVMIVLVVCSYISRTRSFRLFLSMVVLLFSASGLNILFYYLAGRTEPAYLYAANWLRCAFHSAVLMIFVHYVAYICEVTHFPRQRHFLLFANLLFAVATVVEIIVTTQGLSFVVDDAGIRFARRGIFIYAYLCYIILCVVLLLWARKLLFRRIMLGFYGTLAISFALLIVQGLRNQSSYTVVSLLLPVVTMLYALHSNPYDAMLGTNDAAAMQDYVKFCREKKLDFIFMSLYMRVFDEEGKELPREMQSSIRQFAFKAVRRASLFKLSRGHMVLIFLKKNYPDYEKRIKSIVESFYPLYDQYRFDYKIVIGESVDEISRNNEYPRYIHNIHSFMPECSIHRVEAQDVVEFNRVEYVLKELMDISRSGDLNDPRVLVYCQPVLNVHNGQYDTAEALMRLELKDMGIVYPMQFIPLAEEQGCIHKLTEIILHKTCIAVRQFTEAGYMIKRISVNVSVSELKNENFCRDVIGIIESNGIPGDKIAIELTESQNEGDFILMKQKLDELRQHGIRFYLDDFGTGYSNMERIMELPFDTIKFDRSMVVASGTEERSRKMVANLANMFADMDYSVLYEGVERDSDESMCRDMSAAYLQGFKYSKPVPIERLAEYLRKMV